ncbi:hypothetical protein [Streptomyces endophyticus]|uniref:Serine/threonine protein kinase n=1 Tax=Streptomyces endophyticus TaxID=714166 RepID=A0ABU6EZL6_9ACTN|nr:hypothetical protein [Streptomyces endophyticus]MEB8337194.1 hypothetical protein [Streptomyces endophyticus]
MMDIEPRYTVSRPQRASAGLTALAVALLVCGAAVQVTGNLLGAPGSGSGGGSRPSTSVQPTDTRSDPHPRPRSRDSATPSPDHPPRTSTAPTRLPGPRYG